MQLQIHAKQVSIEITYIYILTFHKCESVLTAVDLNHILKTIGVIMKFHIKIYLHSTFKKALKLIAFIINITIINFPWIAVIMQLSSHPDWSIMNNVCTQLVKLLFCHYFSARFKTIGKWSQIPDTSGHIDIPNREFPGKKRAWQPYKFSF